jgi:hypothetical protein
VRAQNDDGRRDAAYNRMRAARVASKWPAVLDMIADGSVSITVVRLLSGVLTEANHDELLRAACGKSKRDVQAMVAALNPQPPRLGARPRLRGKSGDGKPDRPQSPPE